MSISSEMNGPGSTPPAPPVVNWHAEVLATAVFFFLLAMPRLAIITLLHDHGRAVSVFTAPVLCLVALAVGLRLQSTCLRTIGRIVIAFSLFQLGLMGAQEMVPLVFYASRGFPLRDDFLAAVDQMIGFRWVDYAKSLLTIPYLYRILGGAYTIIFVLPIFISLAIVHSNDMRRLCRFTLSLSISLYFVIIVGSLFPSVGAYEHFTEGAKTIPNMFGDKDNIGIALKLARIGEIDRELSTGTAIVQFPSYHACAGVIFIVSACKTSLRILTTVISVLLILATPIGGCHYLVDVLAGILVGVISWLMTGRLVDRLAALASKYTSRYPTIKYSHNFEQT